MQRVSHSCLTALLLAAATAFGPTLADEGLRTGGVEDEGGIQSALFNWDEAEHEQPVVKPLNFENPAPRGKPRSVPTSLPQGGPVLLAPLDDNAVVEPSWDDGGQRETFEPTLVLTFQVQADFAWFDQSPANREAVGDILDGAFFRRSRMGAFGDLYETIEYRIEYDFAHEARPRFLDQWIAVKDLPLESNVIIGHFFEPFSLERYTPNRFATFLERSVADAFAPARNMGAMFFGNKMDERITWAAGVFRTDSNDYGEDIAPFAAWALTAHGTGLVWYHDDNERLSLLHLGASWSTRWLGDHEVRFAERPEIRMQEQDRGGVPLFVDTGLIAADRYDLLGFEAAWVHGPLSVQSEYITAPVQRLDGPNVRFDAMYVFASYFLTGENRSYSPTSILGRFREGIFQRITPNSIAFAGSDYLFQGIGAWEVAARWSMINLNDADIQGGRMQSVTLGLNWYINRFTRVTFNYVHPILDDPQHGRSHGDFFGVRFGFEF